MDTYENENLIPEPVPDEDSSCRVDQQDLEEKQTYEAEVQVSKGTEDASAEQSDGFYSGAGVGVRESTLSDAEFFASQEQNVSRDEAQPYRMPRKVKRKHTRKVMRKKLWKGFVAAALILALVFAGCGISIVIVNRSWQSYIQVLYNNFDQQIEVLRQELDAYKKDSHDTVILPVEGRSPAQIYEDNIDCIVAVNCVLQTNNNGQIQEARSAGSGFVISTDGYIVTNHHVIEGAAAVSVTFADGKSYAASIVGSDASNDIALLKITTLKRKAVTIGKSSNLCVGDQVVAIGNALGELSFSLTVGYVSGVDRNISTDGAIMSMIQTDTSINSGNSGGPLFNSKGEVIGITTAKYSGTTSSGASIEGIGFAIPMDEVYSMLEDLRQYGYITGAYLGVMVRDMDPAVADTYGFPMGAYVQQVTAGCAAEKCGIQAKDIITNVGGYDIDCMSDLSKAMHKFSAGQQTTITVWRGGRYLTLTIVFDEKPTA